jgi:hypothetical protein
MTHPLQRCKFSIDALDLGALGVNDLQGIARAVLSDGKRAREAASPKMGHRLGGRSDCLRYLLQHGAVRWHGLPFGRAIAVDVTLRTLTHTMASRPYVLKGLTRYP